MAVEKVKSGELTAEDITAKLSKKKSFAKSLSGSRS